MSELKRVTYADIARISNERAARELEERRKAIKEEEAKARRASPSLPAGRDAGLARASPDSAIEASPASPARPADPMYGLRSKLRPGKEQLNIRIRSDLSDALEVWCFENQWRKPRPSNLLYLV
jgi:hypothetical protein